MKHLFTSEGISSIRALSENDLKEKIKESMLLLDKPGLKPLDESFPVPFALSWNQFLKDNTVDELLINCYYQNLLFRSSKMGTEEEKWALTTPWFHTPGISHHCPKSGWNLHLNMDADRLPVLKDIFFLRLTPENLERYEFSKLFCLENIKEIRRLHDISEKRKPQDCNAHCESIIKAVKGFLNKLDRSKLPLIDPMGYDVDFFTAWNQFVKGEDHKIDTDRNWYQLAMPFGSDLYMRELQVKDGVVEMSTSLSFSSSDFKCQLTGTSFSFRLTTDMQWEISQWEPKTITHEGKKYPSGDFIPMRPREFKDEIYTKTITFKTGNLMINDWFRDSHEAFSTLTERRGRNFDINNAKGRVEQISHLAEKFNFASVNIGNSCPYIFKIDDQILIGEGPENKKVGSVCTDLWNASIIEEEHLIELLLKHGLTPEQVTDEMAALKKKWTCTSLKVTPGTYQLSFMGDYEKFAKEYKKKNKVPRGVKPYFSLDRIGD